MYNREAINILLWKAEMPCLNVWGVSQASQLCDRCHMSPELCTTSYCQCRLKFTRDHENWTVEDWKRVLWSDKTKINRIGSDGKVYVWKKRGEAPSDHTTTPTVKHGGGNNLMV